MKRIMLRHLASVRQRGVQLILPSSWARPATCILVVGKGRGGMFLLCPRHFQWGAYSITAVRSYVRPVSPVRPIRNTNGFCVISFEKIGVFN